jgi:hypothetical protein
MTLACLCRATLAAAVLGMTVPAAANAVPLNGDPLNVHVGDQGQLQAFRTGNPLGIFYEPSVLDGDAGFFLAVNPGPTGEVFGFEGGAGPTGLSPYTGVSQSPVTGAGSASDPLTQVTTYEAGAFAEVTQTTTYVNGSQQFTVHWDVRNTSGSNLRFKALAAADFFFDGSDVGTGIYTAGPPRFIGGTNADTGNSGGFQEVPGFEWSHYQALPFGGGPDEVWGKVQAAAEAATASFDDSVVAEPVDNAGGVEWDQWATTNVLNGQTKSFSVIVRNAVPSALQLTPSNAGSPKGVPVTFTASAKDTAGTPYAGRTLRWQILGVNAASGSTTVGADGNATIVDPGTNAGNDTLVVFLDFNNNGTREPVEPQASALATFLDNVAPTCQVRVRGDRPVGGGGAGKPLVISVNCDEQATVTVATTLTPLGRPASVAQRRKRRRAIRLKRKTTVVQPGQALAVKIKVPKKVARRYAGRRLRAKVTISARDSAGNVKRATAKRTIKLKAIKKKRRRG